MRSHKCLLEGKHNLSCPDGCIHGNLAPRVAVHLYEVSCLTHSQDPMSSAGWHCWQEALVGTNSSAQSAALEWTGLMLDKVLMHGLPFYSVLLGNGNVVWALCLSLWAR